MALDGDVALLSPLTVACIGPTTAATARQLGVRVDVVAPEHTIDGLVDALVAYAQQYNAAATAAVGRAASPAAGPRPDMEDSPVPATGVRGPTFSHAEGDRG